MVVPAKPHAKPKEDREKGAFFKRKTEVILKAARQLFTEQGFSATSMDAVALAAEVSKTTVYSHFQNKEDLFAAVIDLEAREHTIALKSSADTDFLTKLHRVSLEAFDLLLSATNIATFRTVAAEATRSPQLGRKFAETGPARIIEMIGDFLKLAMDQGDLRPADPKLAATHLLGLIVSDLQVRALLGIPLTIDDADREHFVRKGTEVFLRGYEQQVANTGKPAPDRV